MGEITPSTIHGLDDDVIPHEQSDLLERAMPPGVAVRRYLTGMYAHTGRTGLRELAARAPAALREVRSMLGILRAIADAATHPLRERGRPAGLHELSNGPGSG